MHQPELLKHGLSTSQPALSHKEYHYNTPLAQRTRTTLPDKEPCQSGLLES